MGNTFTFAPIYRRMVLGVFIAGMAVSAAAEEPQASAERSPTPVDVSQAAVDRSQSSAPELVDPSGFHWAFGLGLTFGGDDLAKAESKDGDYTEKLEAGGLIHLSAGGVYRFTDSAFSIQGMFGFQRDSVDAEDGDASFQRTVFDLVGFYNLDKHRFGIGMARHMGPKYKIDSPAVSGTVKFDDATGLILEYDYLPTPKVGVGIRFTDMEYEASDYSSVKVDGSNVGIFGYIYL